MGPPVEGRTAYGDVLPELVPDEPVLAAVLTAHTPGIEPLPPPPPPRPDERKGKGWYIVFGIFALLDLEMVLEALGSLVLRLLRALILGRGARGARTSLAVRIRYLERRHEKLLLVVTLRGLYVFDAPDPSPGGRWRRARRSPGQQRPRLLCRIERSEIQRARVTWYRLNSGRLVIHFTDGSWTSFADRKYMGRRRAAEFATVLDGLATGSVTTRSGERGGSASGRSRWENREARTAKPAG